MEFNAKYCLRKSDKGYQNQIKNERKVIIERIKNKAKCGKYCLYYIIVYTENEDWLVDRGFKLTPCANDDNTLIDWNNEVKI